MGFCWFAKVKTLGLVLVLKGGYLRITWEKGSIK